MRFTTSSHPVEGCLPVRRRVPVRPALTAAIGAAVLLTSACSSGGSTSQAGPAASPTGASSGRPERSVQGAFGLVAEIDGRTFQVQGSGEQTAVTYTSSTTFSQQVPGTISSIKVGDCVSVRSATSGSGGSSSASSISLSPTATASEPVTASRVAVTAATGGKCEEAIGGFDRQPREFSGSRPSRARGGSMPSGGATTSGARPSGSFASGMRSFGRMLTGEVTAVSGEGETLTVAAVDRSGHDRGAGSAPSASPAARTTPTTVTLTSKTSVTRTETASSSALTVGQCAMARGRTDSTGAVTARSVRLSAATNGSCTEDGRG